jgi:DMSO/TMAO reductase YedYZ molybdopterin-dependent catalytic subunit
LAFHDNNEARRVSFPIRLQDYGQKRYNLHPKPQEVDVNQKHKMTRRKFMAAAGGTLVSIGLPGVFVKAMESENQALAELTRTDGRPRIPPGQHAVKVLPELGGVKGPGNVPDWRLKISGEIRKPLTLKFDDLMKLNQVNLTCDVHCVTGWTLLDSRWQGIRLQTVMDAVQVKQLARFVVFEAPGRYSSSIPISEARKENVILAHNFMEKPLPLGHGAPLRSLVPDRYFYKSVKWLEQLRFVVDDEPGYYESGGYSNSADPWKEERHA